MTAVLTGFSGDSLYASARRWAWHLLAAEGLGTMIDRLVAIAAELERVGVAVQVEPDALVIDPAGRRASSDATIQTYADHRMATMGAILALRIPGLGVADPGTTAKTMPDFVARWEGMVA